MGILVLPGRPLSRGGFVTTNNTVYKVVGPLGAGTWLRRLYLNVSGTAGTIVGVSGVLSGSQTEDAATHAAGRPLISRRDGTVNGVAAFVASLVLGEPVSMVLPLGGVVRGGSQYVLFACSSTGAAVTAYWNVGIETVEVRREQGVEKELS